MPDIKQWAEKLGQGHFQAGDINPAQLQKEVVVDTKTGLPRQAGADQADAEWINRVRTAAERSLFVFCKGILGMTRMVAVHKDGREGLHKGVCNWLQRVPPYRKLYLLPRDHLKTSIARGLILHLLMQPKEHNIYFPGCWDIACANPADCVNPKHRFDGANTRILYAGETDRNAEKQLAWAMAKLEGDKMLRAFWPHRMWGNPRKESPKWSAQAMQIPRTEDFPEASIESIGVGGAVTGRHYTVLVKDDIATLKAANSRTVMEDTIEWNKATRALMDDPDKSLEFMLGTRWAPGDVWETIEREDPSVDVMCRAIIEDGRPIFPELFSMETIERLKREEGALFPLIRMNSSADRSIADFMPEDLRYFTLQGTTLTFADDPREAALAPRDPHQILTDLPVGTRLTPALLQQLGSSGNVRLRSG